MGDTGNDTNTSRPSRDYLLGLALGRGGDWPPTCPLRPVIPNNACPPRITAAAGTEFMSSPVSWGTDYTIILAMKPRARRVMAAMQS